VSRAGNGAPQPRRRQSAIDSGVNVRTNATAAIEIVRQCDDEAVVFKPAGLSSERVGGHELDSLLSRVRTQLGWPDARLPHRLDRLTRGLIVVSRDAPAAARHGAEIRAKTWLKWYFARVRRTGVASDHGRRNSTSLVGPHHAYIRREGARARIVRAGGDPSHLTVLAVTPATDCIEDAHVLIRLDTGRFHQIRVMLAHVGFPLVGDTLYGGIAARPRASRARALNAQGNGNDGDDEIAIDLESVALRIARDGGAVVNRLHAHADRRGVSEALEHALDEAISAASS
jgi:23S rRNA-/tRNA-specific pseudouridylate synthase